MMSSTLPSAPIPVGASSTLRAGAPPAPPVVRLQVELHLQNVCSRLGSVPTELPSLDSDLDSDPPPTGGEPGVFTL
ncbi:unnamed protein product [Boreogadus saida]